MGKGSWSTERIQPASRVKIFLKLQIQRKFFQLLLHEVEVLILFGDLIRAAFFSFPLLWQMPDGNWHRIISLGCLCWPCQASVLLRAHSWGSGDTLPTLRHPKLIHLSLLRVVKRFMVLGGCDTAQNWGRGSGNNPTYKWLFKDVLLWKHQTKLGKNWSSFFPLSWADARL